MVLEAAWVAGARKSLFQLSGSALIAFQLSLKGCVLASLAIALINIVLP